MDGHSKKAFSSTKKTPLTQDLKLFQSIYSHDLNLIYSRKSSYTYSTSTGSPSPSQGFLSAAHDLCRKYLGEKMYYNEKMYVKLWLLFAAHVDLFRGELDLGDLQSSVPCPSSRGSCGNNSVYVKTLLKTGEIVTPSTIYQYMITHKIGKYLSVFYLAAANYYESIQE